MLPTLVRSVGTLLILAALAVAGAALVAGQDREVVEIRDSVRPKRLTVDVGTTVVWRNRDGERHRVRSRTGPVEFDSGNLEPGERFSYTFLVSGTYPYVDHRDDEDRAYHGTIVVVDDEPTDGPPPALASVTIIDESFQPPVIEIAAGGTVEWANVDGDDQHTVTSDAGVFDSGILDAGASFSQAFDTPGRYGYFCGIHPDMLGTVVVTAAGDEPPPVGPAPSEPVEPEVAVSDGPVAIAGFAFSPLSVEVAPGTTLTWANDDPVPHTVTATDGSFDSGVIDAGGTFSRSFDEPGTFAYFCAIHPSMTATVIVADRGG